MYRYMASRGAIEALEKSNGSALATTALADQSYCLARRNGEREAVQHLTKDQSRIT
jgi:hypothetical protein